MLIRKHVLITSIGFATLWVGASFVRANTITTLPTSFNDCSECASLDCDFNGDGTGTDKNGDWEKHCKAIGILTNSDDQSQLKLECCREDGKDDDRHKCHTLYDDLAHVSFDHFDQALWIEGLRNSAPKIKIESGDRSRPAHLWFSDDGNRYGIPGHCRLRNILPEPSPSPSPTDT